MKSKGMMAVLLSTIVCLLTMTACGLNGESNQTETKDQAAPVEAIHKLYVKSPKDVNNLTATFINTASGKTEDVKMEKSGEDKDSNIFCCEADANQYNMVHVTHNENTSMDVAFNSFVSGWNYTGEDFLPYTQGSVPEYDPQFETKVFQFSGREKKVYIWTPEDYEGKSSEKYSVIYMFDGQSILTTGIDKGMDNDRVCWNVTEHITSMMAQTDNKAIIVATDNNDVYRNDELVPDLGDINMENESGNVDPEDVSGKQGGNFADFICDTVMPYVNENYNVHTDAQHTALAGASLGGLETFYTVLTHPDKFGAGGVLSATFDMFADKEWDSFLSDKMNMDNAPLLYFYAGRYQGDNGDVTETMYNKLIERGYPKDKLVFSKNESGEHMIEYWRNIYPEFLEAVFTQNVPPLAFGVPVHYEDKSDPLEEYLEDLDIDLNEIKPGYLYFDNSETKWEKVYAYWWGGMAFNSFTKEPYYFAEWPGFEMQQIEGTDIYRIAAPFGVQGMIFDSGVTDRAVAEGKDAYQTTDMQFSSELLGKIYKIDLSVEPSTDPGTMKTKRRYSAGNWSDYSEEK